MENYRPFVHHVITTMYCSSLLPLAHMMLFLSTLFHSIYATIYDRFPCCKWIGAPFPSGPLLGYMRPLLYGLPSFWLPLSCLCFLYVVPFLLQINQVLVFALRSSLLFAYYLILSVSHRNQPQSSNILRNWMHSLDYHISERGHVLLQSRLFPASASKDESYSLTKIHHRPNASSCHPLQTTIFRHYLP